MHYCLTIYIFEHRLRQTIQHTSQKLRYSEHLKYYAVLFWYCDSSIMSSVQCTLVIDNNVVGMESYINLDALHSLGIGNLSHLDPYTMEECRSLSFGAVVEEDQFKIILTIIKRKMKSRPLYSRQNMRISN